LHLHQAKELYGKEVHNLYFHVIVVHVAIAFEAEGNFRNGSAERGESLLARFKRIMKDRHMGNSMKEIMIRVQMENKVEHLLHSTDDKNCKIAELFCNTHEWGEIVIDKKFVDANEIEWKSLLFIMGIFRETKYEKDESGYTFQTVESIKKLCAIQNKPFLRSLEDKILPVSLSRSTDDIDMVTERENVDDILPDDIDMASENVEDIVPNEDMLKYIKLSKKLKSLEESRHLDKIHLNTSGRVGQN
jgi:hypothetical protein